VILLFAMAAHAAAPIIRYDLEADDGGFVASGDVGQWRWGAVSNGPGAGFDGARAWSTGLTADYLNAATDYLEIPVPPLTGLDRPTLSFQHWYEIRPGDLGWVEVDTGNGWSVIDPLYGYPSVAGFTGASGGWRTAVFDLGEYGPSPSLRLAFQSDSSGVGAGWTVDAVAFHDGDVASPHLEALTVLADTDDLVGPYPVEVDAADDTAVTSVTLHWRTDAGLQNTPMIQGSGGVWRGEIPAQLPDTTVSYWVEASDGSNDSREPLDNELSFRVYLPAPTDLTGPIGRVVATTAPLTWAAPDTANEILGYEVLRGDEVVATSTALSVDVPLDGTDDTYAVRAVYPAGVGDRSNSVTIDASVPTLVGLSPAQAWPGDSFRVQLTGQYLLLVQGDVTIDLGPGVQVAGVEVRDVDTAWLDVTVGNAASAGTRDLSIRSGAVSLDVPAAFEVLHSDDRPRLTDVSPARVRQGDTGELVLTHVGSLEGTPTVDLGEGVLVSAVEVDAGALVVRYAVAGDAALGTRAVRVDDGVRVLDGVELEVADAIPPPSGSCGTPLDPGTVASAAALLAVAARRGRRRAPGGLGA
jgi:hypothetical protein